MLGVERVGAVFFCLEDAELLGGGIAVLGAAVELDDEGRAHNQKVDPILPVVDAEGRLRVDLEAAAGDDLGVENGLEGGVEADGRVADEILGAGKPTSASTMPGGELLQEAAGLPTRAR